MTNAPSASQRREFKTDLASLIRIFGDHLYAEADVFVRELVQNAHDSIRRRSEEAGGEAGGPPGIPPGMIRIDGDRAAGTVVVRDNGVGMSEADIETYLTTIGGSGTRTTREAMLDGLARGGAEGARALIGRFGIGLLSAFVVADEVVVETYKEGEPTGFRLVARGGPDYTLEPAPRAEPGTTVRLTLKEAFRGLARPEALAEAVRRYSDLLPYPIFVNGVQANVAEAPWHRRYASEAERERAYTAWVEARCADTPVLVIPVALDDPHVEGALYVSDRRVPGIDTAGVVDVYQARMFVREADPDLLPPWAKFVGGVLDSQALTLTAARDAVRKDGPFEWVRDALGRVIVEALRRLAAEDPHRLRLLMRWHHYHIKGMALEHDDLFEAVADLVPFEVLGAGSGAVRDTRSGAGAEAGAGEPALLTLPAYRTRQDALDDRGRTILYYAGGGEGSAPIHHLCEAQGLLVVSAALVFEEAFLAKYAARHADAVALRCIDVASSEALFTPLSKAERVGYLDLEYRLGRMLSGALPGYEFVVRAERFAPADLPALLTHAEDAETRRRLEVLREHPAFSGAFAGALGMMLGAQGGARKAAVLHLNAASELVERLRAEPFGHPVVQSVWQLVCHSALLSGPYARDPARTAQFQRVAYDALQHVTTLLQRHRAHEGEAARGWLTGLARRTAHTSVYLLRTHGPNRRAEDVVVEAVRLVLEDAPYWFEVVPSEPWPADTGAPTSEAGGLPARADAAHGYLVDLADAGPETWARIGVLAAGRGDRPWVALVQDPAGVRDCAPGVLASAQRLRYDPPGGPDREAAQALADRFRGALGALDAVQRLLEARALRYLSAPYLRRVLGRAGIDAGVVPRLTSAFTTLEEVLEADASTLQRGGGLEAEVATRVLTALRDQP